MTNNKKLQVWLPLLFSVTMIAGMFIGYKMRDGIPGKSFFYAEKRTPVQEILNIIQNKYVDDVNINAIADSGIQAMLAQLDPHSAFIPASELEKINEDIKGSFFGIGIEFNIIKDTLHVINVLKDGPSFIAGLKTGDKILTANDSVISGKKLNIEQIRKLLRGPMGSPVDISVLRGNQTVKVEVKRGNIPLTSIDASYMIDSTIGYIKLNRFSAQTYREFMIALTDLKKASMKELILDLRDNGGGVLEDAVEIADEFLSDDKLITYTEGKHIAKKEYRCRRVGQFETGKLTILANEGTASASEILMGALQDWDRAEIIGRRTFGKGLVQEQYNLSDKSALRLTIARYYTPVGRSIQRPYSKGRAAYYDEVYNRFTDGEAVSADSVKNDTTRIYKTMVRNKRIYGGGGISPDYFVSVDTSKNDYAVSTKLFIKGTLNNFGYQYYLQNPTILKQYPTPNSFVKNFNVSTDSWKMLEDLAQKDSISLQQIDSKEKTNLEKSLKLAVARQLFRSEGYYEALNVDDKYIQKAIEVLRK